MQKRETEGEKTNYITSSNYKIRSLVVKFERLFSLHLGKFIKLGTNQKQQGLGGCK